jgi:hypothetical protein
MSRNILNTAVGALALTLLIGCATVGVLDQPAPLYGSKAKAQYEAEKAAAAKANTPQEDNGQPEPLPNPNDPATDTAPIHAQPPPGQPPSPFGPGPSGVLPDPMSHPGGGVSPQQ